VVISLYYYLRVLKAAYLTESAEELPPLKLSLGDRALAIALIGAITLIGFYPTVLLRLATAAAMVLS
jgi:NADH-quinone oxidoreductase subunit N